MQTAPQPRFVARLKMAAAAAASSGDRGSSSAADAGDDVECLGEQTREERDAELRRAAVAVRRE